VQYPPLEHLRLDVGGGGEEDLCPQGHPQDKVGNNFSDLFVSLPLEVFTTMVASEGLETQGPIFTRSSGTGSSVSPPKEVKVTLLNVCGRAECIPKGKQKSLLLSGAATWAL